MFAMRTAVVRLGSWAPPQQVLLHQPARPLRALTTQHLQESAPNKQLSSSSLYLLDLLPLVYRYLPRDQPLETAQQVHSESPGQQLGANPAASFLYALITLMRRDTPKPTHLAIAVDVPGATFRHRMYPQYKAHRHEHPAVLTDAVSRILAVADAMGITVLSVPGVEVDDVIGTLAVKAQQDGFGSVVIVSTDKDFYQLLSPTVSVLHGGARPELYTLERFIAEQQLLDPRLWIDVKALMGDTSDNIPGLPGIGEKTAKELVQKLGPVEQIVQQLASTTPGQQQQVVKLNKKQHAMLLSEEGQVAAAFMKELVTINTALKVPPCQQPWDVYKVALPPDEGKQALEWAQKLGMDWLFFRLQQHFDWLKTQA